MKCDRDALLTMGKGFCGPPPWCNGQCVLAELSSGQSHQSLRFHWWTAERCGRPGLCGGNVSAPGRPCRTPPNIHTDTKRHWWNVTKVLSYVNIWSDFTSLGYFHFIYLYYSTWLYLWGTYCTFFSGYKHTGYKHTTNIQYYDLILFALLAI